MPESRGGAAASYQAGYAGQPGRAKTTALASTAATTPGVTTSARRRRAQHPAQEQEQVVGISWVPTANRVCGGAVEVLGEARQAAVVLAGLA